MSAHRVTTLATVHCTPAAEHWFTAEEIAAREGDPTAQGKWRVEKRLARALANSNGTRARYERREKSSGGGGRGGWIRQWNVAAIQRDFPSALKGNYAPNAELRNQNSEQTEIVVSETRLALKPSGSGLALRPAPASQPPAHSRTNRAALPSPGPTPAQDFPLATHHSPLATIPGQQSLFAPADPGARALSPDQEALALDRKRAIAPLLDFMAAPETERKLLRFDGRSFRTLGALVDFHAARIHESPSNLWRWYSRFLKEGFSGLANRARSDRGKSKIFGQVPQQIHDDPAAIERALAKLTPAGREVARLVLRQNYSAFQAWEELRAAVERAPGSFGLDAAPSLRATQEFIASWPAMLRDGARLRAKDWHTRHAPTARRDFTTARVMEWWVLDHAQDDFFVYNDFIASLGRFAFPDAAPNAWLRMWLTAFMDVRSRFIVGYAFCATPSSGAICSALRMAVLRTGRPPRFGLLDRGEDMKKVSRGSSAVSPARPHLTEQAHGALTRLIRAQYGAGGGIIHSIGEHPQSKPIESWFKTKRNRFDRLVESYCGNAPHTRPDAAQPLLDAHEKWMASLGGAQLHPQGIASPLPPASLAALATRHWIDERYNREHRHSGHGMARRAPAEVFRLGYSAAEQKAAVAALQGESGTRLLEEFLWDRQKRTVTGGGCVRMYNTEFAPADAASLAALRAFEGQEVYVSADPHAIGDAVAFHPETGERLGALESKQLLAWGETQGTIRAAMRTQRRARRATEEYLALLGQKHAAPFAFLGESFSSACPAPAGAGLGPAPHGTGLPPAPPPELVARRAEAQALARKSATNFACETTDEDADALAALESEAAE